MNDISETCEVELFLDVIENQPEGEIKQTQVENEQCIQETAVKYESNVNVSFKPKQKSGAQRNGRSQCTGNNRKLSIRRCSRRESTMATGRPNVGMIDFEQIKAEVYRGWVGRRDAFDLGQLSKGPPGKSGRGKQPQPQAAKSEDGEPYELESSQVKGVMRPTKGLVASVQQIEEVQRRAYATTPLVRQKSATGARPLRTPSNTALRIGARNADTGEETEPDKFPIQGLSVEDTKRINVIKRRANRESKNIASGNAKNGEKLRSRRSISDNVHGLTAQQIRAFREVFDLFDSNGGGTIDAEELDLTLRSVNICLSKDEIKEVLHTIDKDGSGEIDFYEFLHLMTSTERFLATLTADRAEQMTEHLSGREVLLFEALTEFMKKSAIKSMDEIVGYYSTKYKRSHIPHVVNHYAAGARLIGLTEKQLKEHLETLKKATTASGKNVSPYAQPLHVVASTSNLAVANGRKKTGKIRLKIRLDADSKGDVNVNISGESRRSSYRQAIGRSGDTQQTRGRGWKSQRTQHIEVELPPSKLSDLLPFDELTHEDLPYIRKKVTMATEMYCFERRREQAKKSLQHWKSLDAHLISPSILRNHFRRVFSTYSSIDPEHLPFPVMNGSYPVRIAA